jgi:CubicO group peptidase (beta-lactamase class C family)
MTAPNHQLTSFLEEHIKTGEFPSAVYLVAERDEIVFTDALGLSVVEPYRIANKIDTIYDLASLTKPLVTALLCARRIELGELTLDSSVSHYLGEFDRTDKQTITIRELLTHTSGLPAWRPLYLLTEDEPERAAGAIANTDLEYKPGTRVVYSDLGVSLWGFQGLSQERLSLSSIHPSQATHFVGARLPYVAPLLLHALRALCLHHVSSANHH